MYGRNNSLPTVPPEYRVEKHEWTTAMGAMGYELDSSLLELGLLNASLKACNKISNLDIDTAETVLITEFSYI